MVSTLGKMMIYNPTGQSVSRLNTHQTSYTVGQKDEVEEKNNMFEIHSALES